jgi:hypothetical protein
MPISFNEYLRQRNVLSLADLPLKDYRELMDRKLPPSGWKDSFLAPLITPEKREKLLKNMSPKKREEYLENITKANMSAAHKMDGQTQRKIRIDKEVLKYVRKKQAEREHRLSEK